MTHDNVENPTACQTLCLNNINCNYWTFGVTFHPGRCWLKSSDSGRRSYSGLTSGPKNCGKLTLNYRHLARPFTLICGSVNPGKNSCPNNQWVDATSVGMGCLRSQSFTSLKADLRQDINRVSSFSSRCPNRTCP